MYLDSASVSPIDFTEYTKCLPSNFEEDGLHVIVALPLSQARQLGRVNLEAC